MCPNKLAGHPQAEQGAENQCPALPLSLLHMLVCLCGGERGKKHWVLVACLRPVTTSPIPLLRDSSIKRNTHICRRGNSLVKDNFVQNCKGRVRMAGKLVSACLVGWGWLVFATEPEMCLDARFLGATERRHYNWALQAGF